MKVSWISAGVSSFISTYLVRDSVDRIVYIDITDQHEDSMRFIKDCEKVLGREIEIIRSSQYADVDQAVRAGGMVRSVYSGYAYCTDYLKKRVRKEWEQQQIRWMEEQEAERGIPPEPFVYVWGMDYSKHEQARAKRIVESNAEYEHEFPLINQNITKQEAHAICARLGVK